MRTLFATPPAAPPTGRSKAVPAPQRPPREPAPFVGRESELEALARMFHDNARLVTIVGTAGIGKSRLAARYAAARPGRVWSVAVGADDPTAAVDALLADGRPGLLVLDDVDTATDLVRPAVGRVLAQAADVQVLATGRSSMGMAGEEGYALPPLSPADGVALLRQRCPTLAGCSDSESGELVALSALLGQIPFALELAAARVAELGISAVRAGLQDDLNALRTRGGRLTRTALVGLTVGWSVDLLPAEQRTALEGVLMLPDRFTLADAAEVVDGSDGAAAETLRRLVASGLIFSHGKARFTVPSAVRDAWTFGTGGG